jgi:antitoxin FitA
MQSTLDVMTMLQIRHMPEATHRTLKERAAKAGMSLSDYALRELERVAETPTREEVLERLRALPPVEYSISPTEVIREERDVRS